jgi:hypothetical protein
MKYLYTSEQILKWLRENTITKYWYATHGHDCTEDLLQRKAKQYPSHYTSGRMSTYRKHIAEKARCADCVGAIKYAFWSDLGEHSQKYGSNGMPDVSADGLFRLAKELGCDWGAINTIPERPSIAVRYAGHVGYYMGGGIVREWRGFDYGRVDTKLKDRRWTHWYEIPFVDYSGQTAKQPDAQEPVSVGTLGSRLLKKGHTGDDVTMLQQLLMELGYELPEYGVDGDYGNETEAAVMEFQGDNGLTANGQYDEKSHEVMMDILAEREAQEDESESEAVEAKFVEITGNTVNVREGAGTQHEIITVVRKGTLCVWRATAANGWHAVILPGGREGWIGPKYSKVVDA